MATMLDVYYGEFLTNPVPLELSFNWCSHGCSYCFANLNKPDRDTHIKDVMQLLTGMKRRKGIDALLLRESYPVLISNRTDAFALSNYKQALPVMQTLADMGIPMAIQTKGGRGIDEALAFMQPSCWYISISFDDDGMRTSVEPGAPSLDERFELIEKLIAKGHTVYLGLNPLVPEWIADPAPLLRRVKSMGVYGVWIELLHLNRNQVDAMTQRERNAIGETALERAKGALAMDESALRDDAFACARDIGLETYCVRQTYHSHFWEPYHNLYPKHFKTNQDFVNWCHHNKSDGESVTFEDYAAVMLAGMPEGEHRIENYIRVPNRELFLKEHIPAVMTYREMLRRGWNDARLWFSPVRFGNFAFAVSFDEADERHYLVDEHDDSYLIWDSTGSLDCGWIESGNPGR